jgi:hypothetical protein
LAIVTDRVPARTRSKRLNKVRDLISFPDGADDDRLRLILALLLCGVGVGYFRQAAWSALAAVAVTTVGGLAALWVGFHRLGMRSLGSLSPGWTRGATTALMLFVVLPPGLPAGLVAGLVLLAVVVEGSLRHTVTPLAVGGVLVAWPIAWLWQVRFGLPYLSPIDLRHLDEPARLWRQASIDPLRMYAGNVAGPLGATSMMVATLAFLALAYARRASWHYVLGFFAPVAAVTLLRQAPLTVYLISGPAVVFAGVLGADTRRLPRSRRWQAAGGVAAGSVAATLIWVGLGWQAFAAGVTVGAIALALLQLLGPAGAKAPTAAKYVAGVEPQGKVSARLLTEVVAMALAPPVGWILVAADGALSPKQRRRLIGASAALFAMAAIASLFWLYYLRLPA